MALYTGAGARRTPQHLQALLSSTAKALQARGWVARSGHAAGADKAIENGAGPACEIYLPFPFYQGPVMRASFIMQRPQPEAFTIAREFHPNWSALDRQTKCFMARNVHMVLGRDVNLPDPSIFMLCWTPGGNAVGGTGHTIRVAEHYGVGVYNLALASARDRLERFTKAVA